MVVYRVLSKTVTGEKPDKGQTVSEDSNWGPVPIIEDGNYESTKTVTGENRTFVQARTATLPPDGTYLSRSGVKVRVIHRAVPDSRFGSIEIALIYGQGGAAREAYFLHQASTKNRLEKVFSQFLKDISPLGESYPVRSLAQKAATARLNGKRKPKACQ